MQESRPLVASARDIAGLHRRVAWRLFGIPARFGPSRTARLILLRDLAPVRRMLARIAEWDFDRIIVTHGDVLDVDARGEFERAFARYRA